MKCMRCGTKIQAGAVFCEPCLTEMDKHPVDPNTPISLPAREKHVVTKRSKKRAKKPEDIVRKLRRVIGWLMALVLVLAMALAGAVYLLVSQPDGGSNLLPGQNYGTEADPT